MTNTTTLSFAERIKKASKYLSNVSEKELEKRLKGNGIDNDVLDASTTTFNDIQEILTKAYLDSPHLKVKMAVAILKGDDPLAKEDNGIIELSKKKSESSVLADLIKSQRPISQWSDEEVLNKYIENNGEEEETELQRRAKNRPFIILQEFSNTDVDVPASLAMLKRARKDNIPSSMKTSEGKFIRIYKVEEYHITNRVKYESPLRPGVILFDGYCNLSKQNFLNISEEAKKMLRLIYEFEGEQSRANETQLVITAEREGIEGLATLYPDIYEKYKELELAENLPNLKVVVPLETKADPFKPGSGHKVY